MAKQLVPDRYAAARKDAADMVAWYRDHPVNICGFDVLFLGRGCDHAFGVHMVKQFATQHPIHMMFIVDSAKGGWRIADEALRQLILEFTDQRKLLPTYLASYAMDITRGTHRFLPGREKIIMRDIAIFVMTAQLAERHHLKPTGRNRRNSSACEIVASALGEAKMEMSYDAVKKIWKRYQGVKCGTFSPLIKSHPEPPKIS